jgi:type VI secretion system protein ImpJ
MTEAGRPLDVALGIRGTDDRGPQTLGTTQEMADARFLPSEDEVYDLEAGQTPAPVERLTYTVRIFLGDEVTDGYETISVARLVRTGDTAKPVKLDDGYSPPALALNASPVLHETARSVVERLALTLRKLGQKRGSNVPDPLILYYGLSGSLPVLRDMVQDGHVHPRRVYQELARLAGALFYRDHKGRTADEIPAYDHQNPGPVFYRLHQIIEELSEIVIQEAFERTPMEREGDLYRAPLPAVAKEAGAQFYLEVTAGDSMPKVSVFITGARISNPHRITTLVEQFLPGVSTEKLPGQPPQLPAGQQNPYFRLKHETPEWETHVAPAGQLAVFILNAPADLKLNLIVTLPST